MGWGRRFRLGDAPTKPTSSRARVRLPTSRVTPPTPPTPRTPPPRRSGRDWLVDTALFGATVLYGVMVWRDAPPHYVDAVPHWMHTVDPWVGAAACLALWWRRRWPLLLGLVMVVVLMVSVTGLGAALVTVLTVAVHRNWVPATLVTLLHLLPSVAFGIEYPPPGVARWAYVTLICLMYLVPLGWGIAVRARRQLIANLRLQVDRERREQRRRLDDARRAERERIAREMHDVLAHRISLISVHAGALAYRTAQAEAGAGTPLDAVEVGGAIEVIRDNARQALLELGDVLTVLRANHDHHANHDHRVDGRARGRDGYDGHDGRDGCDGHDGRDGGADGHNHVDGPADGHGDHTGRDVEPDRLVGDGADGEAGRRTPQPRLADLPRLVGEARAAGQRVRFEVVCPPGATEALRPAVQRCVYRAVQEGLTNARKHAGGAEVMVRVEVDPGVGIVATVSNPLAAERAVARIPGAGAGLTGLAERLALHGGTVEHGVVDGAFRLTTRLPLPA